MKLVEMLRQIEREGKPLMTRVKVKEQLSEVQSMLANVAENDPLSHAKKRLLRTAIYDILDDVVDLVPGPFLKVSVVTGEDESKKNASFVRILLGWNHTGTENNQFFKGLMITAPETEEIIEIVSAYFDVPCTKEQIGEKVSVLRYHISSGHFISDLPENDWNTPRVFLSAIADALHAADIKAPRDL